MRFGKLAPSTVDRVKQFRLDYLGISVRSATLNLSGPVRSLVNPAGAATVLARVGSVAPERAALAKGNGRATRVPGPQG